MFLLFLIVISLVFVSAFNFNSNIFVKKGELKVTDEHPFFLNESWVKASELNVGDELVTVDGKIARIVNVKDVNEETLVYNLRVNGYEDYFAEGILVHNKAMVNAYLDEGIGPNYVLGRGDEVEILLHGEVIRGKIYPSYDENKKVMDYLLEDSNGKLINFYPSELDRLTIIGKREVLSPTYFIESVGDPMLESSFWKTKGLIIEASSQREYRGVKFIPFSELPDEIAGDIRAGAILGNGYSKIHTHPYVDEFSHSSMIPSLTDVNSFLMDYDLKSSIIAIRNTDTGEVAGYIFLKRIDSNPEISAEYLRKFNNDVKDYSPTADGLKFLDYWDFFGKVYPDVYFSGMEKLREYGITYRIVPNKNAGYVFDEEAIGFIKK